MKKRAIGLVLAVLMLCSFIAVPMASAEGVTLSLVSWYTEENLKEVISMYREATGNDIEIIYSPPVHDYVQKLQVLLTSGEYPDLFYVAAENKRDIGRGGYALDIQDLPIWEGMSPIYQKTWEYEGQVLAYAPDAWVGGTFVNLDLFEQYGATVPTNWAEFTAACKVFQDAGLYGYLCDKTGVHNLPQMLFENMTIAGDLNFEDKINSGELTYKDGWAEPLRIWDEEMVKTGLLDQAVLGLDGTAVEDMFLTGQVAMMPGGPWSIAGFREKNPDMKFDLIAGFGPEGSKVAEGAVNVGIGICSKSENIDAAKEFLSFFADHKTVVEYQKVTGQVLGIDGIEYELDPIMVPKKDNALTGSIYLPQIFWKHSESVYKALLEGCQNVVGGLGTAEEVYETMQLRFTELEALEN